MRRSWNLSSMNTWSFRPHGAIENTCGASVIAQDGISARVRRWIMQANWILNQVLALSLLAAPVFAAPLGVPGSGPGDAVGDSQPRLEILAPPSAVTGSLPGTLAISSGAASTQIVPPPVASNGAAVVNVPPQFARLQSAPRSADTPTPWTIEVNGLLRQPALAGNALFLIYDAQDPEAIAQHEVIALWQAPLQAGNRVAARLSLSPDDGFHPAHSYLIQVAQIINGKEQILAEGELRLQ